MKTVAEYRAFAGECRSLMAKLTRQEDKQALERVARAWDNLADEREARLLRQIDGETLID
jgi:hypothetical protein